MVDSTVRGNLPDYSIRVAVDNLVEPLKLVLYDMEIAELDPARPSSETQRRLLEQVYGAVLEPLTETNEEVSCTLFDTISTDDAAKAIADLRAFYGLRTRETQRDG